MKVFDEVDLTTNSITYEQFVRLIYSTSDGTCSEDLQCFLRIFLPSYFGITPSERLNAYDALELLIAFNLCCAGVLYVASNVISHAIVDEVSLIVDTYGGYPPAYRQEIMSHAFWICMLSDYGIRINSVIVNSIVEWMVWLEKSILTGTSSFQSVA